MEKGEKARRFFGFFKNFFREKVPKKWGKGRGGYSFAKKWRFALRGGHSHGILKERENPKAVPQPAARNGGYTRMKATEKTMEKIVNLCKNRGFVYPGSEIYGGLANSWDYGPLGVELKNNIKKAWWKKFVQENPYNVGLDAAILMNPQTWVASGHLGGFSDPLMDCRECHERFRADKLIEDWCAENGFTL